MSVDSNKRLAKNTIALYIRTFVTLIVTLYTSRIVLKVLGIEDFGIYNVIGSIVVMFSFLSNALTYASQRFLTFELGRNNIRELTRVFSMSLTSVISLALIIILLSETIGLWFLNNELNIPPERLYAAKITYHLSILTFCFNIIRTPYIATIISYEKMTFFAYISILEALVKLAIVFLLQVGGNDKLILYGLLLVISTLLMNIVYYAYCIRNFEISRYIFFWDKKLYLKLMTFSGWSLLGSGTNVATQNGLVFLINIYWGVAVNASLGIANQVNAAVSNFISSFQTSFRPQIIKAYAENNQAKLNDLISKTSKFSFMLMFIPTFILMLNMHLVLKVWLNDVPDYSVEFCIWMLACAIIDATTGPYYVAIMATGNIKLYQIAISISFVLDIICTFILIKLGISPSWVFVCRIITRGFINMFIGLHHLNIQLEFKIQYYNKEVIQPILISLLLITPIPIVIMSFTTDWQRLVFSSASIVILASIVYYKVLLTNGERRYIFNTLEIALGRNKNV